MNENKSLNCAVARDLMPLYVENLTEDETAEMMRTHIAQCAACAQSYGMQKTKLEIEKKPRSSDFRGIRFFKKSFLKRVALLLAVLIMGFIIVVGGLNYLFSNRMINADLVKLVGQYELSKGRIVLAMQADGYCVNNLEFFANDRVDSSAYTYSSGYRQVRADDEMPINVSVSFISDRFRAWTRKADERGDVFYYLFDPAMLGSESTGIVAFQSFATPAPTLSQEEAAQTTHETPELQLVRVNGERTIWRKGDPLRKLTEEEEEILLRAMEKAGVLERSVLLPETDIIDVLMEE